MTSLWEESNVEINHPGEKELQQGDMEERTENILYPTDDGLYDKAVRIYYAETFNGEKSPGIRPLDELLKELYDEKGESNVRKGINDLIRNGTKDYGDEWKIPTHNHLRQVDGAAEVYSLIGGDVDKRSITYEKIREQSVETMRENPTYQFCMLLAGFNNDKMDKYWITPSETLTKRSKRRKVTKKEDVLSKEIIQLEATLRDVRQKNDDLRDRRSELDKKLTDEQWKIDALNQVVSAIDDYIENKNKKVNVLMESDLKIKKMKHLVLQHVVNNFNEKTWFDSFNRNKDRLIKEAEDQADNFEYKNQSVDLGVLMQQLKDIKRLEEEISNKKKAREAYSHLSDPRGFHDWYTSTSWADGRLHLSPLIYAHIEEAYNVVRRKWNHLKDVKLNQLIESPDVRSYFARLTAWCMRTSDCLSGKRFHLQSTYARVNHEKNKLLNVFRHVYVMGNELVYKRDQSMYPFIRGTQTSINGYLDDKNLLKLHYPRRPIEKDIVNNMLTVNQAMSLSKAYNKL